MKKLAILIWLYHNDLAVEFFDLLYPLQDLVDIHLSFCQDNDNSKSLSQFNSLINIKSVTYYPNIGADLYSFINTFLNIDNPYFIKLHSKKSRWGASNRCNWRAMLLDSLVGNRDTIIDNTQYMEKYNLGSIGCGSLIYNNLENKHSDHINKICKTINLENTVKKFFFAGTMFMGKTKLYQEYINRNTINQLNELLQLESGKINDINQGTYSHGMERVLGYIGSKEKLYPCPLSTFKIRVVDQSLVEKIQYLHIRRMYNNDVYCIEQPNIYGKVLDESSDGKTLQISWRSQGKEILAVYHQIYKRIYFNEKHIHK
jgi:hypothetical protein